MNKEPTLTSISITKHIDGATCTTFTEPGPFGGARQWKIDTPDALGMTSLSYYDADADETASITCHKSAIAFLVQCINASGLGDV